MQKPNVIKTATSWYGSDMANQSVQWRWVLSAEENLILKPTTQKFLDSKTAFESIDPIHNSAK